MDREIAVVVLEDSVCCFLNCHLCYVIEFLFAVGGTDYFTEKAACSLRGL